MNPSTFHKQSDILTTLIEIRKWPEITFIRRPLAYFKQSVYP